MHSFLSGYVRFVAQTWDALSRISAKRALTFFHDLCVVALSMFLAFVLRLGWGPWSGFDYLTAIAAVVAIGAIVLPVFGVSRGIWRYASIPDLFGIVAATTATMLLLIAIAFVAGDSLRLPRSVPGIAWFVQIILLSGSRLLLRVYRERRAQGKLAPAEKRQSYLIYGVHDRAAQFVRAVNRIDSAARVVGIIDDRQKNHGRVLHGVPVLGGLENVAEVMSALAASNLYPTQLVLASDVDKDRIRSLVEAFAPFDVTVTRVPDPAALINVKPGDEIALQPIALEDLLGRKAYSLHTALIGEMIVGKRVMVLGAGGSIGAELCSQIAAYKPARLVMVDASEFNLYSIDQTIAAAAPALDRQAVICSVSDRDRIHRVIHEVRPHLIFHAAALKHVPLVEANACEGVSTNVFGTINAADAALAVGTGAFLLISTDKAVQPTSVMGASKRIAEAYCQALDLESEATRFMTVRFGNVLGSSGSVVPLFQRQLSQGGPLTVTHPEMTRYFMTVGEAAGLVLQATVLGLNDTTFRGSVFVLDMGEPVKIVELARNMIRLAGLKPEVDVKIEYRGLRPGEKLFEQPLDRAELPQQTDVDGVLIATPRVMNLTFLRKLCGDLEDAVQRGDDKKVRAHIRTIVPEFAQGQTTAFPLGSQAAAARDS